MTWDRLKTPVSAVPTRYILVALAIVAGLLYLRYAPDTPRTFQTAPGPVTTAEEIPWVEPEYITPPPKIRTLPKVALAEKLKMPELEKEPGVPLVAVTIPAHTGPTNAVAMLDNTGVTRVVTRQLPPPFWQVKKEFGARAGMGTGGLILGELYARPLRVGNVEIEVRGFALRDNVRGADFGGVVLLDYRF